MKHLKKFENYNNDLTHEITYSLIDLLDDYGFTEITDESSDNYPTDGFLYTYIQKEPDITGKFQVPKAFHRNCNKGGLNYVVLYSNGYPGLKFQEIVDKSVERLSRLYDVKVTKNNENSSTIIKNEVTGENELIIPCRTWVIEISEKSQFEGLSNRICDRCGKKANTMSMSWLNTDECCMDCLEAEKDEPDYILAKQKESEQVRKGNLNYKGWRHEG